jgi:HEAT repeat protein
VTKQSATQAEFTVNNSQLVERLCNRESTVRRSAAELLGKTGPSAIEAVPALLKAAVDVDPTVRKAAGEALNLIDPSWSINPLSETATPGLILALGSRFADVSQAAFHLLGKIGQPAIPELVRALGDKEKDTRQVLAARTLGQMGANAASAVPALVETLTSEYAHVRQAVAEALCEIGSAAEPAVPALCSILADRLPTVRRSGAKALARVGRGAELAMPALIQLLADREDEVREAAIEALAHIGPGTVPSLIVILETREVRRFEEWLKKKIEFADWSDHTGVEELQREPLRALHNTEWYFRHAMEDHQRLETAHEAALRVLAKMGPAAVAAVPVMVQALADPNRRVRLASVRALGPIGPEATAALPALTQALADSSEAVRKAAAEALPRIDPRWASHPDVQASIASLIGNLKKVGEEGQVAVAAFTLMGPASVPVLIEALAADDRILREAAATTLGRIGPAAQAAIPALTHSLEDRHGWVREAAANALKKVDPQGLGLRGEVP